MQVLQDPASIALAVERFPDPDVRRMIAAHVAFLAEQADGDPAELLRVIVVEPGDTLGVVDAATGGLVLANPWSGMRFGEPGFAPSCETLDEYPTLFELTFIVGDGGLVIVVLVPRRPDIDAELLALCASHATPAEVAP